MYVMKFQTDQNEVGFIQMLRLPQHSGDFFNVQLTLLDAAVMYKIKRIAK